MLLKSTGVFGLGTGLGNYSAQFISRLSGPSYEDAKLAQADCSERDCDEIAVVLIDDDFLGSSPWPIDHMTLAFLMERIYDLNPRAVFLDLFLPWVRDANEQMVADKLVPTGGPPLYLADVDYPRLMANACGNASFFTGVASAYACRVGDRRIVGIEWSDAQSRYPAQVKINLAMQSGAITRKTPAFALYGKLPDDAPPLTVRWGYHTPPVFRNAKGNCRPAESDEGLWDGLAYAGKGLLPGLFDQEKPICPFHDTISAREILDGKPDIESAIKHRFVLVGTRIRGVNDFVETPIHGQIPGVYMHAMALDNLLRFGGDYWGASGKISHALKEWIFGAASILVIFAFSVTLKNLKEKARNGLLKFAIGVAEGVSPAAISFGIAYFLYHFCRWSAGDWISVTGAAVFAELLWAAFILRRRDVMFPTSFKGAV